MRQNLHAKFPSHTNVYDIAFRLNGLPYNDIIAEVAWNEEKKLAPNPANHRPRRLTGVKYGSHLPLRPSYETEVKIKSPSVEVFQAGFGWSKLLPVPGPGCVDMNVYGQIIQFRRRFIVSAPVSPLLKLIELEGLEADNKWVMEMRGGVDTQNLDHFAELVYV